MSVLMNFAMFPTDKGASVSPYVARVVESIRLQNHASQLTAMGTIVETDSLEEAMQVVEKAYQSLEADCDRVYVTLSLDIRKGGSGRISSKVKSVEDKLA
jgi:uncharacterized protein (TIGR00106 family)